MYRKLRSTASILAALMMITAAALGGGMSVSCSKPEVPVIPTKPDDPQSPDEPETPTISSSGLSAEEKAFAEGKTGLFAMPEKPDVDDSCVVFYRADSKSPFYNWKGDLYAHIGLYELNWFNVQAEWDKNTEKCLWQTVDDDANLRYIRIRPSVRDWFGAGDKIASKIALVIRNADGSKQTSPDMFLDIVDRQNSFTPVADLAEMPSGLNHGINYNSSTSVTLVLHGKGRDGSHHEYCCVIGDFSSWARKTDNCMKWDESAGCWWITLDGLEAGKEYRFQYILGNGSSNIIATHDPYSEIVYDGDNDGYIPASTYPGLEFPDGVSGTISAFQTDAPEYDWKNTSFKIADSDNLVIYEMHLRDFSTEGDINGALNHLDYLKALGINAIELMPVQEFDGNDSWGYNPCSYFALDKAYGTRDDYKKFIDECHGAGIAVLLDVVYNHATGAHPMAKMWWDSTSSNVSANNPYFNQTAPHPYSVYHDWDHSNSIVREHIARSLEYLMSEYQVDGFRFDLTKGFTNNKSSESTASNYDASRIDNLSWYYARITAAKPDAVMICEHFCCDQEEKELAKRGMKLWRNCNNAFSQAAMGYGENSSFAALWTGTNGMSFGGYVGFAESHDEERNAYKALTYGISGVKGNLAGAAERMKANAAFLLLCPGPKMIWQFGELAYDYSIEYNDRTGRKPVKWDYYTTISRKALYDTYCALLKFRNDNPGFFSDDADFKWAVESWDWNTRTISCTAGSKAFAVVANYNSSSQNVKVTFPSSGTWKDEFGNGTYEGSYAELNLAGGEFKLFSNF